MIELIPITIGEAKAFVRQHHRHHRPPQGALFAVGAAIRDEVVGCAIVGRPVSRMFDDGFTVEVTRCCTLEGARNAGSMLYGACWRAARALGYRLAVTYTLPSESGATLRGAGWRLIGAAGGGKWTRVSRPRVDLHPMQTKLRWEQGGA